MDTSDLPAAVAEYLSENRTELFEFTETIVGYDTQNPPGRTVDIVEWVETTLEESALSVERFEVDPEKPNLIATLPGQTDRTLCFNGHLDTVPFDEGDWSYEPLGERDGERLYGRGTTDMKGAVAAMLQVALAYARTETEPPVTLQFAFVSDEETGGDAGLTTLLETTEFDPDACVVGETTSRNGRYSISVADRGNIWLTLEASGTAAHGSRPMIGENAIDRLTTAVEQLRNEFGQRELSVDSAMDEIIGESVDFYEPEAGAEATRTLYRYPTINLGIIEGGTAINTVPASACARVDIRLTAGVDTRDALSGIRNCLAGMDGIEITDISWTRGSYEPLGSPIVEASARAADHVVDDQVYRRSGTGGGDAKVLRHEGIPTVEFGFGTQTAHGTDEYTTTEALVRNAISYGTLPVLYEQFTSTDG
ncbi:M20 family metallopeptidase [Halapricum hydrolyticum]|uniref:M20/M25/M40 family metallo-hydrolase n=1 Tax=Halapricum hydrolyticum TaxID=2979991 RepID=A0AAE3LHZ5_9EURY|nr:M20/M25/M40 family metallo-hydrolase [Halapricum hydrolyticum]MCU4718083.1 M20/M25/M40 family metallo-hydrolase [Halapricum hydrolyticum]MCU4727409.1 M20/M25/M40 family metallo-hydrolase [Halapricum hydrolyticum]